VILKLDLGMLERVQVVPECRPGDRVQCVGGELVRDGEDTPRARCVCQSPVQPLGERLEDALRLLGVALGQQYDLSAHDPDATRLSLL
jgi:hypothetical protein